jgi:hypothetical protein
MDGEQYGEGIAEGADGGRDADDDVTSGEEIFMGEVRDGGEAGGGKRSRRGAVGEEWSTGSTQAGRSTVNGQTGQRSKRGK